MSFAEFRRRRAEPRGRSGGAPVVRERAGDPSGPATFEAEAPLAEPAAWVGENLPAIEAALGGRGAVLLRGFGISAAEGLEAVLRAIDGEPMSYRENTSPRSTVKGLVKTSTDHPADQSIEMHSEQSYSRIFPLRLYFACARPADRGGETPIADTRRVLARIPRPLRERLAREGYLYRRIFHPGLGPPWQETYEMHGREALERHLAWAGIAWHWDETGILHTEIRRSAVARHPATGERAWFNHALFWHPSSLEPELAGELLARFGEDGLPNASFHGDGSPFTEAEVAAMRKSFRSEIWLHRWEAGDLLILDNILWAHGRRPYEGARRLLFGMARPTDALAARVNWIGQAG